MSVLSDSLEIHYVELIRDVMRTQDKFVKVHAAEYLIQLGYPEGIHTIFEEENKNFGSEKAYRIGIWRVLAQVAKNANERNSWIDSIKNAFMNTNGEDRIHAIETLAKLNVVPAPDSSNVMRDAIEDNNNSMSLYAMWAASNAGQDAFEHYKEQIFNRLISGDKDDLVKILSSYILRRMGKLNEREWDILSEKALNEPDTSGAKIFMISAAYVNAPDNVVESKRCNDLHNQLCEGALSHHVGSKTELAAALAIKGDDNDLPLLLSILHETHPLSNESERADVRAAAAYAIIGIDRRYSENENNLKR